jgi:hypothetical protein
MRPDPLRRLHLGSRSGRTDAGEAGDGLEHLDLSLRRSSLPAPTPSQRARVALATRRLADQAADGLPPSWSDAVHDAATPPGPEISDALDQAVLATDLGLGRPRWWSVVAAIQWLLATLALLGLVWLVAVGVFNVLQLPRLRTPDVGPVPVPTALLLGGLLLGFLVGAGVRAVAGRSARARRQRAARRLHDAVSGVARERIVAPVVAVLSAHRETRQSLTRALR